ncbi:MAG TPA: glycosyltransferase family 4 protein [Chloroflexia bacterium]|nr:glycosyltransferase family 4 protein [Chloroflexia bacterium]
MRVLMLAPLWYPISRDAQGGIETFLYSPIEALEREGCSVMLLASGDSRAAGELVPVVERNLYSLMHEGRAGEYVYYEQHQLRLASGLAHDFDVVHSHIGPGGYVLSAHADVGGRVLHTVHSPVYEDICWFVGRHPDLLLSAVSEFQAERLRGAGARRCRVVHNGIDTSGFPFNGRPGGGLLFLGRIEAAKGPDLAIDVARALGLTLTLAGPVIEREFFKRSIEPRLDGQVRYVGVVDHETKCKLMGEAACMLLPFRQAEPFGMVSIEAMTCGTPVVALPNGALPEIVEPGVTGYLAAEVEALPGYVLQAMSLDRGRVRERATARFGIQHVAGKYLDLYRDIAAGALEGERQPCA